MSEEMEVACLWCLSDDKSSAETFWVICQMTNCPQRRFESSVRWQIARRDVLSSLSDDKLPAETFWAICQMTNRPQRRFKPFVRWQIVPRDVLSRLSDDKSFPEAFWDGRSLRFKKNNDLRASPFWSFCLKGYFYGLPRWRSQWRVKSPLASPCPLPEFHLPLNPSGSSPIRGVKSSRILFGRLAGGKIMDCHADARNDGLGTWVYKSFFPCSRIKDCIFGAKRYG